MYGTTPDPTQQDLAQARLDVEAILVVAKAALEPAG